MNSTAIFSWNGWKFIYGVWIKSKITIISIVRLKIFAYKGSRPLIHANCCRHHGRPFLGLWLFLRLWFWVGGPKSCIKFGPGYIRLRRPSGCPGNQKQKWRLKLRLRSNLKGLLDTDRLPLMQGMIIKQFAVVTKWLNVLNKLQGLV